MLEMKKDETVEFLLVLKDKATPVHIQDSRGERIYSANGFCEAIDMAVAALSGEKITAKFGRWIYDPFNWEKLDYKCSNCSTYANNTYDYCPYCGAKMDVLGQKND